MQLGTVNSAADPREGVFKTGVTILNQQDKVRINRDIINLVRRAVKLTLEHEKRPARLQVTVLFTDNETIQSLNSRYRKISAPTDVLAFPMIESGAEPAVKGLRDFVLGDVVISVEKAFQQASEHNSSLESEMALLAIHGTLHLLGYEDYTDHQAKEMEQRQRLILSKLSQM